MTSDSEKLLTELEQARKALHGPKKSREGARLTPSDLTLGNLFLKATTSTPPLPAPRKILFVRPDSFGDLVLFVPALNWLRAHWPKTEIGLLIKSTHQDIVPLLPADIVCLIAEGDPFREQLPDQKHIESFLDQVRGFDPGILVAPCYEKTWFHALSAQAIPKARRVALGPVRFDPTTTHFLHHAGIGASTDLYSEVIAVDRDIHELEKSQILLNYLTGLEVPSLVPRIHFPEAARIKAERLVKDWQLPPKGFVLCNPAGMANVKIKSWPPDYYAEVLKNITGKYQVPVLVCVHEDEKWVVDQIIQTIGAPERLTVWLGRSGDLSLLAALASMAKFYLGNDTATMHIAEAVETPAVAIFGGGTWPRFKLSLPVSISLVHPLPCFGCGWDCHLGDAPCVKLIEPADVINAISPLLAAQAKIESAVNPCVSLAKWPADFLERIRLSREIHNQIQKDREDRYAQILQHAELLNIAERSRSDLNDNNRQLTRLVEQAQTENTVLRSQLDKLQARLQFVENDSGLRLQQIEALTGMIRSREAEASASHSQIEGLSSDLRQKNQRLADLDAQLTSHNAQSAATEAALRDQLNQLSTQFRSVSNAAALREQHAGQAQAENTALRSQLDELHARLQFTEKDSGLRLQQIETLTGMVNSREAEASALVAQIEALNALVHQNDLKLADLNAQLAQQIDQAQGENTTLRSQLEELTARLQFAEDESGVRLQKINTLTGVVHSQQADADTLRNQLQVLNANLQDSGSREDHLGKSLDRLEIAIKFSVTALAETTRKLEVTESNLAVAERQSADSKNQAAQLSNILTTRNARISELENAFKQQSDLNDELRSENATNKLLFEQTKIKIGQLEPQSQATAKQIALLIELSHRSRNSLFKMANRRWSRLGRKLRFIPEIDIQSLVPIEESLPSNTNSPLANSTADSQTRFIQSQLELYRAENERLARELTLTRIVQSSLLRQKHESTDDSPGGSALFPITAIRNDQVWFHIDRCNEGPDRIEVAGWAFSPEIDCAETILWLWLCSEKEQRLVLPSKVIRPDVGTHFADLDLGPTLPIKDPRRKRLDRSGFSVRFCKSDLASNATYRLEIQVEGPTYSARRPTDVIIKS